MGKIRQLHERKNLIMQCGKRIRDAVSELVDNGSFVELSTFSFSESEFYPDGAQGEGVVTGFATVQGYPFYIVAQNGDVLSGGVSKANCDKISKCLDCAEKSGTSVIYLLDSKGVRVGEGVNVLEGIASLLLKAAQLKGSVMQFAVIFGEVYGQIAALSAICDFTFFIKDKSVLAANSPLVISAKSGVNSSAREIGSESGLDKSNLVSFAVESVLQVRKTITSLADILSCSVAESEELNVSIPGLDKDVSYNNLLKVFDKNSAVEVGVSYCNDVKCVLGRVGGIATAAVFFDGADGVKLNARKVKKIKDFAEFACCRDIPLVNFVNCTGLCPCIDNHNSLVLKEVAELINVLDCCDKKIAVISGKAVGLGYTLFAAKNMGYDYSYAFANAKIALFDDVQGAEIEFEGSKGDKCALAEKYAEENSDPINAARNGFIDNIIEPAFVKQYLVASLQMLVR